MIKAIAAYHVWNGKVHKYHGSPDNEWMSIRASRKESREALSDANDYEVSRRSDGKYEVVSHSGVKLYPDEETVLVMLRLKGFEMQED